MRERERERERILYEMDGEKHMIENILFLAKGQKSFLSLGFFFFFLAFGIEAEYRRQSFEIC